MTSRDWHAWADALADVPAAPAADRLAALKALAATLEAERVGRLLRAAG
jgi:hypothetical protein